ncbi:MAG: hypothetical protein ACE5GN_04200 [Waddliaceae bacterium]
MRSVSVQPGEGHYIPSVGVGRNLSATHANHEKISRCAQSQIENLTAVQRNRQRTSLSHRFVICVKSPTRWLKALLLIILGWFKRKPSQNKPRSKKASNQSTKTPNTSPGSRQPQKKGKNSSQSIKQSSRETQPSSAALHDPQPGSSKPKTPSPQDRALSLVATGHGLPVSQKGVYPLQKLPPPHPLSVRIQTVLEAPYFTFALGNHEQTTIWNPFSLDRQPTDDEVYQFNLNLKNVLHWAKEQPFIHVRLGEGPSVWVRLPTGSRKRLEQLGSRLTAGLLTLTARRKESEIGRSALPAPAKDTLKPDSRAIQIRDEKPPLPASNRLRTAPAEATKSLREALVKRPLPSKEASLQEIAARQQHERAPTSQKISENQGVFPLFQSPMPALESGRNLLLNYVEGLTTVWDQDPLQLGQAIQYCVELSESKILLTDEQKEKIRLFFDKQTA